MGLIDSHAHLTFDALVPTVDDVLDRATAAGVEHVLSVGTDPTDARRVIELARRDRRVSAIVGIHPHEAAKVTDQDWEAYRGLIGDPSVVALGEMGLDYHYDFADRTMQRTVFERQLALAFPSKLPIVIHCREAHEDAVGQLIDGGFDRRLVVFHCFSGSEREAADIADHGWRISFTGIVTFKNVTELQRIAAAYPIDQMMIETDSPYLSPVPVRHVRPNEPAHVAHIARFLSELKAIPFEELAARTTANTRRFFNLPAADAAT